MEKDINMDRLQRVYEMKKTWVEINHLLEGSMEHNWIIWSVRDDGL
jgi:MinD-like ATPase involved in chromosome partitioning or flagellar assembly